MVQLPVHALTRPQVNGAAVNLRAKGDKLAVWLAESSATEAVMRVGRLVKARLGLQDAQTIVFSVHKQERAKSQTKKITV